MVILPEYPSLRQNKIMTVENGRTLKGKVRVDGKNITPSAGKTYTGKITVTPL
jgi:hypothetical protein